VQIVEPHMYSPGDAVAKVDGYVISVVGGGPYVGEKHLVRIDQAGRTAAMASLLDAEPSSESDSESSSASAGSRGSSEDGGDDLQSKPRRRGRRGGRRRSGAKATSAQAGTSSD
jgi:ribonuclease G